MKELLEEYITEALQLREQIGLLTALVAFQTDDPFTVTLEELRITAVPAIQVEDGVVSIG